MSSPIPDGVAQRLIVAGAADIRQFGPRRMTISGLAERLGMSHANVYRHFADKKALISAVLAVAMRPLDLRLADIVGGPDPADDKLERFLTTLTRGYAEMNRQDPAIFALLASADFAGHEQERHRKRIADLIGRIVAEGIATRSFGGSDARPGTMLVMDLCHRFIDPISISGTRGEETPGDIRRDRVIRAAVRVLAAGRS